MSFSSNNKSNTNKTCLEEYIRIEKFSNVRLKNKKTDEGRRVLDSIISCYVNSQSIGINKDARNLSKLLYKEDLEVFCRELFYEYIESNNFDDKKWLINFCAIHGGEEIIFKMEKKIYEWISESKISISLDAIVSLALNGNKNAFKVIEKIQRRSENKKIKAIVKEAFNFAIDEFNMQEDEFRDSIVPDLGLDEKGVHIFLPQDSKVCIYLIKLFDFMICDGEKVVYKTIPKITGASKEQNILARRYLKDFKRQLQNVTYRELDRLESELSSNRKWSLKLWINVFLKNPIMRTIAETFIWGIYYNSKIQATMKFSVDVINNKGIINIFSYKKNTLLKKYEINDIYDSKNKVKLDKLLKTMKECEFNNKEFSNDINDYTVNLVHPVDLTMNQLKIWKNKFEELNVLQPVDQLYRLSFTLAENETQNNYIDRFEGKVIKAAYLLEKMNKFGWYRGSFNSNGTFFEFYKKNTNLKIGAQLNISGISPEYLNEDTVVKLIRFYRLNNDVDEIEIHNLSDEEFLKNYEVPKRFFSEVLYEINAALLKSINYNK